MCSAIKSINRSRTPIARVWRASGASIGDCQYANNNYYSEDELVILENLHFITERI